MANSILRPFQKFADEGATIGRLLAGYSTLEIGLMNCVQVAIDDFDTVLKTMFKQRGEGRRIEEAENLGLEAYVALGLGPEFQTATAAMRHCLDIRNQYAHWIWWDDNSGQLAFANMEDIAKTATPVNDLGQLNPYHVDAALLHQQEAYFVYTDYCLAWVNYEGRAKAGKIRAGLRDNPSAIPRPPLRL